MVLRRIRPATYRRSGMVQSFGQEIHNVITSPPLRRTKQSPDVCSSRGLLRRPLPLAGGLLAMTPYSLSPAGKKGKGNRECSLGLPRKPCRSFHHLKRA
jgi:hypothetical protein